MFKQLWWKRKSLSLKHLSPIPPCPPPLLFLPSSLLAFLFLWKDSFLWPQFLPTLLSDPLCETGCWA